VACETYLRILAGQLKIRNCFVGCCGRASTGTSAISHRFFRAYVVYSSNHSRSSRLNGCWVSILETNPKGGAPAYTEETKGLLGVSGLVQVNGVSIEFSATVSTSGRHHCRSPPYSSGNCMRFRQPTSLQVLGEWALDGE